MKIAVTSQNRKTITGHAGKCRKFWIYQIEGTQTINRTLLELPINQSFHESAHAGSHPLDDVNVLISGGMGQGLQSRLKQKGIMAMCTPETDPNAAVQAWLSGTLKELPAELHDHGHDHGDSHHQHHHHGAPTQEVIGMQSVDQLFSNMFRK